MARLDSGRRSSRPEALVRNGCPVLPWDPTPVLRNKNAQLTLMRTCTRLLFVLALACLPVFAQTDVNDVHIQSREVQKPDIEKPKQAVSLVSIDGLSTHVRPLKVDVDLVLVPVTITDPLNRLVTGLEKDNFQLLERRCPSLPGCHLRFKRQHEQQDGPR